MQAVDFNSDMGEGFGPWTIGDGVDAELASRYLLGCGELSVRELAAGVVGSSEDAMPDDRTAAVLRLRLTESRSRTKKRVLSRIGML